MAINRTFERQEEQKKFSSEWMNIQIDDHVYDAVTAIAERNGMSRSQVIATIVDELASFP